MTIPATPEELASARAAFVARTLAEALEIIQLGGPPEPKQYLIYLAINRQNGKTYVGATKDFRRRLARHLNDAANGCTTPFHQALREQGEHFAYIDLEVFDTKAAMFAAEKVWIAALQTQDREIGYNVLDGGKGMGEDAANAAWANPEYRKRELAKWSARAIKASAKRAERKAAGYYIRPKISVSNRFEE